MTSEPLVAVRDVSKAYGHIRALRSASFTLRPGEVHALFGANGAGKSTLAGIISGQTPRSGGALTINGHDIAPHFSPREAIAAGVGIVTQETSIADDLTIWENVVLPHYGLRGRMSRRDLRQWAARAVDKLGFASELPLDTHCADLSAAHRQLVEIARIVALGSRVIILDEPTASLSPGETSRLFGAMDRLRREGQGLIFVSHRLEEIFAICDRITVLRDGETVAEGRAIDSLDQAGLIRLMVGHEIESLTAQDVHDRANRPVVLSLNGVGAARMVHDATLDLHEGEIVGLGGLIGSGRSELAEIIVGLRPMTRGTITLQDAPYRPASPVEAMRRGVGYLPEDRWRQSIVPDFSVRENILLCHLGGLSGPALRYASRAADIDRIADLIELPRDRLDERSMLNFSGGMQQKALLIRALLMEPRLLVLDEPTRGIDIGSRATIYRLLRQLAAQGLAILLISSDFEELLALSHRIVPISDGRTLGALHADGTDEEQLTLIAVPRTSLKAQQAFLTDLAQQLQGASAWFIPSGDRLFCLSRDEAGGDSLPAVGEILTIGDDATASAVADGDGRWHALPHGGHVAGFIIENARGHLVGIVGVTCAKMPGTDHHAAVGRGLADLEDGRLRVRAAITALERA